jgi:hypothetical protein
MAKVTVGDLQARLSADTSRFERNMRRSEKTIGRFGSAFKRLAVPLAAFFGGRRILGAAQELLRSFSIQEEAVVSLGAALAVTGKEGADSLDLLTRRAAELQQVTTKGDEAIISATASLAQLATELSAADLASAQEALVGIADTFLKGDVENAALLMGKTIGSTTNALTRYGIQLDANASQQEKLAAILAQSDKFFQVSQERAKTLTGRVQQLSNAWGDLKEQLGEALAERADFTNLVNKVKTTMQDITTLLADETVPISEVFALAGRLAGFAFSEALLRVWANLPSLMERVIEEATQSSVILRAITQPFQLQLKLAQQTLSRVGRTVADGLASELERAQGDLAAFLADVEARRPAAPEPTLPQPGTIRVLSGEIETLTIDMDGATESAGRLADMMSEGARVFESTRTPAEAFDLELERLNNLLIFGAIDWETYERAVQDASKALERASETGNEAAESVGATIGGFLQSELQFAGEQGGRALIQGILDGTEDLKQTLKRVLKRFVEEAIIAVFKIGLGIASPSKVMMGFGQAWTNYPCPVCV